jgi:hypothetical protein
MEEIPMNRLALVLAAATLGTGCVVVDHDDCDASTITLSWSGAGFQRFDGTATGCVGAGVTDVDVFMNDAFVATFACADGGAVITRVPSGTHALTVEGIDAARGVVAYRDEFTVQTDGCGNRSAGVTMAEGSVNLDYQALAGCTSSPCFLWFSIHDDVANATAAAIDQNSPAAVKNDFPYPDDVVVRLPAGSFTLDFMQLVSSSFLHEAITCGTMSFAVSGGQQTLTPVIDLRSTCP